MLIMCGHVGGMGGQPFRDATFVTADVYELGLRDCLAGLARGVKLGWCTLAPLLRPHFFTASLPSRLCIDHVAPASVRPSVSQRTHAPFDCLLCLSQQRDVSRTSTGFSARIRRGLACVCVCACSRAGAVPLTHPTGTLGEGWDGRATGPVRVHVRA